MNWKATLKTTGMTTLGAFVTGMFPVAMAWLQGSEVDWRKATAAAVGGALMTGFSYIKQSPWFKSEFEGDCPPPPNGGQTVTIPSPLPVDSDKKAA